MKKEKIPLLIIAGPTASGKTALAVALAKQLNTEVVSADSMQVYRYMDIGTAKPDLEERQGIIHHMIDVVDPDQPFSVADYAEMVHPILADIYQRGKLPVLAGGTGLYLDSVAKDVEFGEADSDPALRGLLQKKAEEEGPESLLPLLEEVDPVSAGRIHPNNVKRVIRAIEFYQVTGKPISVHQEETKKKQSRYDPLWLELWWDREVLYERINRRADLMLEAGLVEEVKGLMERGYTRDLPSMQGIGYKEIMDYLCGGCTLEEAMEMIRMGSRRYAKRQLTWFGKENKMHKIPGDKPDYGAILEQINSKWEFICR